MYVNQEMENDKFCFLQREKYHAVMIKMSIFPDNLKQMLH